MDLGWAKTGLHARPFSREGDSSVWLLSGRANFKGARLIQVHSFRASYIPGGKALPLRLPLPLQLPLLLRLRAQEAEAVHIVVDQGVSSTLDAAVGLSIVTIFL